MKTLRHHLILMLALSFNLSFAHAQTASREPASGDLQSMAEPEPTSLRNAVPLWEAANSKTTTWTQHVYRELDTLGVSLLKSVPADVGTFCPNYKNLSDSNRKAFWTFLLSAMTRFESNFNPDSKYTESFKDSKGQRVVSRGLLQLSIESANAYGCGFKSANELHDPLRNLSCGLRILNRWMAADQRIAGKVNGGWRGGARYWSVLRTTNKNAYPSIVKWTQSLALCN